MTSPKDKSLRKFPDEGPVRRDEVLAYLQIRKSTLYERIDKSGFPAPFKVARGRTSYWLAEDVRSWFEDSATFNDDPSVRLECSFTVPLNYKEEDLHRLGKNIRELALALAELNGVHIDAGQ